MRALWNVGLTTGLLAVALAAPGGARADSFQLNYEAPGAQNSTATFSEVGVETFDSLKAGMNDSFKVDFGGTGITGVYSGPSGVQINAADQYGGAGGSGNYAVAFGKDPYTLTLNKEVNYFGYWLSALDPGNVVTFYDNGVEVGQVAPGQISAVTSLNKAYSGNPNAPFSGKNSGEPYAFINFYDTTGMFNEIRFSEAPNYGGGYESDNHTVGIFTKESAASQVVEAPLPLLGASPIAILVLAAGFLAARRRNGDDPAAPFAVADA